MPNETTFIRINKVEMEWTEDSRRKPRPCLGCKQPTTGLVGTKPYCVGCALAQAFEKARA